MERNLPKPKVKQILGVSINPHLYKKLKKECQGQNVSAFVEKAIAKELTEKEQKRKEFRQKLIADYKIVAKSQKRQSEDEIWDETTKDGL